MIALWIVYSIGVSTALGLAAATVEYGLRRRAVPLRGIWCVALAGSLALCLSPWMVTNRRGAAEAESRDVFLFEPNPSNVGVLPATAQPSIAVPAQPVRSAPSTIAAATLRAVQPIDRPLRYLWGVGSALLIALLAYSIWDLHRQRRAWKVRVVDGVPALVSRTLGPAVVGFFRARIVLPEWVLGLEHRQRALVIAHEEEHLRAGDPRLVAVAILPLILMPWNPALWWQVRRLRHALELDCDARVLKRCPNVRTYGNLLIELGRRSAPRSLVIAAFAESSALLERRIETLAAPRLRGWGLPLMLSWTIGVTLAVLAVQVPRPALAQAERPFPVATPEHPGVGSPGEGGSPTRGASGSHLPEAVRPSVPAASKAGVPLRHGMAPLPAGAGVSSARSPMPPSRRRRKMTS